MKEEGVMLLKGAAPGVAGSMAGWFLTAEGHLSVVGIAMATGVSCLFGMLSSMSRLKEIRQRAVRQLAMNAGAVWLSAFIIAAKTDPEVTTAAMIGLGVGLAGTKILEVIEVGVLALTYRLTGVKPVSKEEFEQKLGDVRQKAQIAVSEVVVEQKRPVEGTKQEPQSGWGDPDV